MIFGVNGIPEFSTWLSIGLLDDLGHAAFLPIPSKYVEWNKCKNIKAEVINRNKKLNYMDLEQDGKEVIHLQPENATWYMAEKS